MELQQCKIEEMEAAIALKGFWNKLIVPYSNSFNYNNGDLFNINDKNNENRNHNIKKNENKDSCAIAMSWLSSQCAYAILETNEEKNENGSNLMNSILENIANLKYLVEESLAHSDNENNKLRSIIQEKSAKIYLDNEKDLQNTNLLEQYKLREDEYIQLCNNQQNKINSLENNHNNLVNQLGCLQEQLNLSKIENEILYKKHQEAFLISEQWKDLAESKIIKSVTKNPNKSVIKSPNSLIKNSIGNKSSPDKYVNDLNNDMNEVVNNQYYHQQNNHQILQHHSKGTPSPTSATFIPLTPADLSKQIIQKSKQELINSTNKNSNIIQKSSFINPINNYQSSSLLIHDIDNNINYKSSSPSSSMKHTIASQRRYDINHNIYKHNLKSSPTVENNRLSSNNIITNSNKINNKEVVSNSNQIINLASEMDDNKINNLNISISSNSSFISEVEAAVKMINILIPFDDE